MFFKGSYVAMVTPFKEDGNIDEVKIRELVNYHIENGTSGIVPCGTTGESPTLSYSEHKRVIEIVVEEVAGRIQVVAGAGSNSTKEAIELTKYAKEVGADAVLSIVPYYNKPGQDGIYAHFAKIASEVDIPIMLYNVPGRTGVKMEAETIARLAKIENIKGIKEACGCLEQVSDIKQLCGDSIDILSGDDSLLLPMLSIGAVGVVSVTANFMAKELSDLLESFAKGDIKRSQELHYKLFEINKNMFIESNPVPVKSVMQMMGTIREEVRLPLTPLKEENKEILKELLKEVGIL